MFYSQKYFSYQQFGNLSYKLLLSCNHRQERTHIFNLSEQNLRAFRPELRPQQPHVVNHHAQTFSDIEEGLKYRGEGLWGLHVHSHGSFLSFHLYKTNLFFDISMRLFFLYSDCHLSCPMECSNFGMSCAVHPSLAIVR